MVFTLEIGDFKKNTLSKEARGALSGLEMKDRLEAAYPWKPCQKDKSIQIPTISGIHQCNYM